MGSCTPPVLTCVEWLNSHDSIVTSSSSLLATGCNDGCVRVYKPSVEARQSVLVTAWSVSSMARVGGMMMRYDGEGGRVVVSYHGGRSSVVGVWDLGCERLVREIGGGGGDGGGKLLKGEGGNGGFGEWWVSAVDCNRCGEFG